MFRLPGQRESADGCAHILISYFRRSQQTFQAEALATHQGRRAPWVRALSGVLRKQDALATTCSRHPWYRLVQRYLNRCNTFAHLHEHALLVLPSLSSRVGEYAGQRKSDAARLAREEEVWLCNIVNHLL
jgi:hypothetical protein